MEHGIQRELGAPQVWITDTGQEKKNHFTDLLADEIGFMSQL